MPHKYPKILESHLFPSFPEILNYFSLFYFLPLLVVLCSRQLPLSLRRYRISPSRNCALLNLFVNDGLQPLAHSPPFSRSLRLTLEVFGVVGSMHGLGVKCSKEVATAIRGTIILAKLSESVVQSLYKWFLLLMVLESWLLGCRKKVFAVCKALIQEEKLVPLCRKDKNTD